MVEKFFYKTASATLLKHLCPPWPQARGWDRDPGAFRGWGRYQKAGYPGSPPVPGRAPGAARWLPSGAIWWPEAPQRRLHGAGLKQRRSKTSKPTRVGRSLTRLNRAGLGRAISSPATTSEEHSVPSRPLFPVRGRLPLRMCSTFEKRIHLRGGFCLRTLEMSP